MTHNVPEDVPHFLFPEGAHVTVGVYHFLACKFSWRGGALYRKLAKTSNVLPMSNPMAYGTHSTKHIVAKKKIKNSNDFGL